MSVLEFGGEYRYLSNFSPSLFWWRNQRWPTVEHAYQASKNPDYKDLVLSVSSPAEAKHIGKHLSLISGWEDMKLDIMTSLVLAKFEQNEDLGGSLMEIKGIIEEGNHWHDTFWGVCHCDSCCDTGENWLGRILMDVRDHLIMAI